jgi:REase_DpnII-MboI
MMRALHDNVLEHPQKDSLLKIIDERIYLKPDVERLMDDLIILFRKSIPIIYQHTLPQHENDLNDKVEGLLNSESDKYYREYPGIPFALAKTIPDHSSANQRLYIESKYVKEKGRLSKLTDEIAADLVKYTPNVNILFLIYDPNRAIHKDEKFSYDFEQRDKRCKVALIR